jgi:hypothetical protein
MLSKVKMITNAYTWMQATFILENAQIHWILYFFKDRFL